MKITIGNLLQRLNQPYPLYYSDGRLGKLSLAIASITASFLILFKPINIEIGLKFGLVIGATIYGSIGGLTFYCYLKALLFLFPKRLEEDSWTVGKEIGMFGGLFLLVGLINYVLRPFLFESEFVGGINMFITDLSNTFLVGVLVSGILTLLNFRFTLRNQEDKARLLQALLKGSNRKKKNKQSNQPINGPISIESKYDNLVIDPTKFIYAKADGNYIEVVSLTEANQKELKRIPLKELESAFSPVSEIVKVHRAYLVNIQFVLDVAGNAQGYRLCLKNCDVEIPVSRSYLKAFDKAIAQQGL